jgi:hypothetical protein
VIFSFISASIIAVWNVLGMVAQVANAELISRRDSSLIC